MRKQDARHDLAMSFVRVNKPCGRDFEESHGLNKELHSGNSVTAVNDATDAQGVPSAL